MQGDRYALIHGGRVPLVLGVGPAGAACCSARQALVSAEFRAGGTVLEETAASERYIAAGSWAAAARLGREREERRARGALRGRRWRVRRESGS